MKRLYPYWYFILPLVIIVLEFLSTAPHVGLFSYYRKFLTEQPVLTLKQLSLILLKVYLAYFLTCLVWNRLSAHYLGVASKISIYLFAYSFFLLYQCYANPALLQGMHILPLVLSTLSLAGYFQIKRTTGPKLYQLGPSATWQWTIGLMALWGLFLMAPHAWERNQVKSWASHNSPNIIWIGLDGVPQSYFTQHSPTFFKRWAPKAYQFTNTFSPSNSTYNSWVSLLTGQFPSQHGVQTLFPNERLPQSLQRSLAKRLQKNGYETVYMTDCGSTAFQSKEMGFNKLYQLDKGAMACGRGLITSLHPLLDLFPTDLFGELQSFCSAMYQPKTFWKKAAEEIKKSKHYGKPIFLALHSCYTHSEIFSHLPSGAIKLNHLLNNPSKLEGFKTSLEYQDTLVSQFIDQTRDSKTWHFLFSDHGFRLDENAKMRHATGLPIGWNQYHVPLYILNPSEYRAHTFARFNSLIQIYDWTLKLSQRNLPSPSYTFSRVFKPVRLFSSYPKSAGEILKDVSLDDKGVLYFSKKIEKQLQEQLSWAEVTPIEWTLHHPDGKIEKTHFNHTREVH